MTELTMKELFDRRIYRKGATQYSFLHPVTGQPVGPFDRWKDASDALNAADAPINAARVAAQSVARLIDIKDVLIHHLGSLVDEEGYDNIARDLLDVLWPSRTAEQETLGEPVRTWGEPEIALTLEDLQKMPVEELRTTVGKFGGVVPAEHDRQVLIELIIDLADWEIRP